MRKLFLSICCLFTALNLFAQASISSNYADQLDLEAVLNLFCQSSSTEEFEKSLNSAFYNQEDGLYRISNLDLNRDGYIDYLRCLEYRENNKIYILIQACLDEDSFYEVASICSEIVNSSYEIYIVGDEHIYGLSYIVYSPIRYYYPIYNWIWSYSWRPWHSCYYYGYFPSYYVRTHCVTYHTYRRHIESRHSYRVANNPSIGGGNRHSSRRADPGYRNDNSATRAYNATHGSGGVVYPSNSTRRSNNQVGNPSNSTRAITTPSGSNQNSSRTTTRSASQGSSQGSRSSSVNQGSRSSINNSAYQGSRSVSNTSVNKTVSQGSRSSSTSRSSSSVSRPVSQGSRSSSTSSSRSSSNSGSRSSSNVRR